MLLQPFLFLLTLTEFCKLWGIFVKWKKIAVKCSLHVAASKMLKSSDCERTKGFPRIDEVLAAAVATL